MVDSRFEVALRRVIHEGKRRITMQKVVRLPIAPTVGLELRISAECTFVVDQVCYALETGTFRATDRSDRHGGRRASQGGPDAWRNAGFEVVDVMREQEQPTHSPLYVVRESPLD
jgi:hypothetical protein